MFYSFRDPARFAQGYDPIYYDPLLSCPDPFRSRVGSAPGRVHAGTCVRACIFLRTRAGVHMRSHVYATVSVLPVTDPGRPRAGTHVLIQVLGDLLAGVPSGGGKLGRILPGYLLHVSQRGCRVWQVLEGAGTVVTQAVMETTAYV
jgi:hypothetical protein